MPPAAMSNRIFKPLLESLLDGSGVRLGGEPSLGHPGQRRSPLPAGAARFARHRRVLRGRRLGLRRARRAVPPRARLGRPAESPDPRRGRPESPAIPADEPADQAPLPGRRRGALRHRPPDVRALPRAVEPVHLLLLRRNERPRARRGNQARDALRQAGAQGRRSPARHRLRLGRLREVRGADPRLRGHGHQPLGRADPLRGRLHEGPAGHDPEARLPRPARLGPARRSTRSRSSA